MHSPESLRGNRDHATVLVQDITDFVSVMSVRGLFRLSLVFVSRLYELNILYLYCVSSFILRGRYLIRLFLFISL